MRFEQIDERFALWKPSAVGRGFLRSLQPQLECGTHASETQHGRTSSRWSVHPRTARSRRSHRLGGWGTRPSGSRRCGSGGTPHSGPVRCRCDPLDLRRRVRGSRQPALAATDRSHRRRVISVWFVNPTRRFPELENQPVAEGKITTRVIVTFSVTGERASFRLRR